MATRILIIDDHTFFRIGLRNFLTRSGEVEVVGESGDSQEACRLAAKLKPDVVLMGLKMMGEGGLEATRIMTQGETGAKVVGLSGSDDPHSVRNMLHAGAVGYVSKGCRPEELLRAINRVIEGEIYLGASVTGSLFGNSAVSPAAESSSKFSRRERQILRLQGFGMGPKEIAGTLSVSINTVKTYLRRIKKKAGSETLRN